MALPTAWDINDKSTLLNVDANGLKVDYIGYMYDDDIRDAIIRANNPIPSECKLFYFEIDIIEEGIIAIGFCSNLIKLNNMPGFESGSWGYHSDDGEFFNCSIINKPYGPTFTIGDTIGCCLNFINKTVFYTKNGVNLGITLRDLNGNLFPCVGLKGGSIKTNFGQKKFIYTAITDNDIDDELMRNQWVNPLNQYDHRHIDMLEDLANSLKIKSNDKIALKYRGKIYFVIGRYEKALEDLTSP